ncbi:MAG: fused N-dimethylarginine dimethylaminohydrolase/saccharopine dehydrogenase domain-containing protein, partial [Gammaproteobacteria bacterium]|nr:fused N-dimethylarginine dimethylaminohydrolase/saccharopine dehydrogenase domain-containing protein [Gammaproteobacteria bacterium]
MTRLLVCPPTYFGVEYVINPWMAGNVGEASQTTAMRQWDALVSILEDHADVYGAEPQPGLPDMCFAANGGLVLDETFVPATFSVAQREPESGLYRAWAEAAGFEAAEADDALAFEGEGDALWWPAEGNSKPVLWAGYGVRTSLEAHRMLTEQLHVEVVSLRLVDQRFYHLDTCFVPLPEGRMIYYPPAFDEPSRQRIESLVPPDQRIEVGDEDAYGFACNAVRLGNTLVTSHATGALRKALDAWGFDVIATPLTEFIKAGGAAKCLTLVLDQDLPDDFRQRAPVESPIRSRLVELEGHLLDEGVMNHAFDTVNRSGSSFRLERFRAGERSDQTSLVRFVVSAPNRERLDDTIERLDQYGARMVEAAAPATLVAVDQDGVAPDDFCCSTIYPTEIRVGGSWVPVKHQRMDAAIVVDGNAQPPTARCTLMRDLRRRDQVVCGEAGVRVRIPDPRHAEREFAFMSSEVTTERRAEGQIEELALEMRRIRARGGRIVVVAGPVVIHTGGGRHLGALIRDGYVQALLAGNALAVHDIETNFYGTSLGVDLNRGLGVQGGHRHHLTAINRIRAAGSIEAAVEAGAVTGGVMYECVKAGDPYAL